MANRNDPKSSDGKLNEAGSNGQADVMENDKKDSLVNTETAGLVQRLNLVVVGSSAGGLEALQEMLASLPALPQTAILIAQHLSPVHKSMLVDILKRESSLVVKEAADGEVLQAGYVYVTPPDSDIEIQHSVIRLSKPSSGIGPKPSVDRLFLSVARSAPAGLVGVILSGTGTDGAEGAAAIHHAGGFVVVQEPELAKYNGMPMAVVNQGIADEVVPAVAIGKVISRLLGLPKREEAPETKSDIAIAKTLELISLQINADFSNYKSATIRRRMQKRINLLKLNNFEEYLDYLRQHPEEAHEMFSMMLIGVTSFFRDKEAFESLNETINDIVKSKPPRQDIRFWVPGCSTGEEAYSIAILLHQALGGDLSKYNIQIFASDIDEKAIQVGRRGIYPASSLEQMPDELRSSYFTAQGNGFELSKTIRSMVLFSKHDVTKNPPFLRLDLISCRNLLIYFDSDLQQQVLPIFHYALNQDGYLFLGRSESIGNFGDLFGAVDQRNKLFRRLRGGSLHTIRFAALKPVRSLPSRPIAKVQMVEKDHSLTGMIKETLFNSFDHPYVVINSNFDVLEVFGDVRLLMGIPQGSMEISLLKLINKELMPVLRTLVTRAVKGREAVTSNIQRFELYGTFYYVRFVIKPLIYAAGTEELFLVIFEMLDMNAYVQPVSQGSSSEEMHARLAELENELAMTREHLQSYIEELETSNEELQSLNEELQSTNEEFQSTNEELETTNEELQATNEEMHVAYSSLDAAKKELEEKEQMLQENKVRITALLDNELQAFMLIDASYRFQAFNKRAVTMMEKLSGKQLGYGQSMIDFVPPTKLEEFIGDFRYALKGHSHTREVDMVDAHGEPIWFLANFTPGVTEDEKVISISLSLLDITFQKNLNLYLEREQRRLNAVLDATTVGIHITDHEGNFVAMNQSFCQLVGYDAEELTGHPFTMLLPEEDREAALQIHRQFIDTGAEQTYEWALLVKNGELIRVSEGGKLLVDPDGRRYRVCSVSSIMEKIRAEAAIRESEWRYRQLFQNNPIPAFVVEADSFTVTEMNLAAKANYQPFLSNETNNILALFEKEEAERFSAALSDLVSSEENALKLSEVWKHHLGDGKMISTELTIYKTYWQGKTQVIVNAMDLTPVLENEKLAAKLLAERNDIIDSIGDGFVVLNLKGEVTYWNNSAEALTGIANEEILGRHFRELGGEKLGMLATSIEQVISGKHLQIQEVFDPLFDKWLDIRTFSGKDLISLYFRDVSEQHKALLKQKETSERFEWLISATNVAVWDWDVLNNDKYVNDIYYNLFGAPDREVDDLFMDWVNAIHPEDRVRVLSESEKAMNDISLVNYSQEYRMRKKNGDFAHIVDTMHFIRDEQGHVIRSVGMVQDVSAQRRMEIMREQLNESLREQAEVLRISNTELEQFAYVASHDLQEPVRSIISFVGKLEASAKDRLNERETQYLQFALGAGRRIRQIIMDLLEYSRVGRRNDAVEQVDVRKVVEDVVAFLHEAIQASNAEIKVLSELPQLHANNLQIHQLLQNVIGNGLKYSKPGVPPVVSILSGTDENGDCVLSVTDNGIGIAAEHQEKIFELFQRLHGSDEYSGSGIGLAVAKKIMLTLGGSIRVESKEGKGTTFFLVFPKNKVIASAQ